MKLIYYQPPGKKSPSKTKKVKKNLSFPELKV